MNKIIKKATVMPLLLLYQAEKLSFYFIIPCISKGYVDNSSNLVNCIKIQGIKNTMALRLN